MSHSITADTLPKLVGVVDLIRQQDPLMPLQTFLSLLLVAEAGDEGILQHELGIRLGLSKAAAFRNVSILSKYKGVGLPGLGLVEAETDPQNRRYRRVTLSEKGKRLIAKLSNEM